MSAFFLLTGEAVLDAVRRRIVVVIAAVSLLSLMMVDSCTSCGSGQITVDGELRSLVDLSGYTGSVTFLLLGLWSVVLAGVLAAEHLAGALDDGSAPLALSRPVGRGTFAFARLAGALSIAFTAGALLLGGTAFFLASRSELTTGPAVGAAPGFALGAITVGALAMTLSLTLPRIATVMLVFLSVFGVAMANVLGFVRPDGGGLFAWIDRFGPPLLSAPALALDAWTTEIQVPGDATTLALRGAAWALASMAVLWASFRRMEI